MPKLQLILIGFALILVGVLFQFPKGIVHNFDPNQQPTDNAAAQGQQPDNQAETQHRNPLSATQQQTIQRLKKSFENTKDKEKSIIFADSLAILFASYYQLDSAAMYREKIAALQPSTECYLQTANAYYEAFKFASNEQIADKLGEKARAFYQKVLAENPDNYEAKVKMGVTYVTTNNPMQGITLIREVLEKDPDNPLALLNLGVLSMQSQQYDKAIERFEQLLAKDPQHEEAQYYLAESYATVGKKEQAKAIFEQLATTATDSLIRSAAKEYVQALQ